MPSLSDFGLAPEEPQRHERRRGRYVVTDESGARPLPTQAYDPALDEEVELPVSRAPAGLYFGIGVGLGIAVIAIVAGLYFRGAIGGPTLAPSPEPAAPTATQETRFQEWMDLQALERARLADVRLTSAPVLPPGAQVESPNIEVVEESLSTPHPRPPAATSPEQNSQPKQLTNELDELERSLRPRGPTAPPRAPSNDQAPPEVPLPPPAEPTAPAETSPPGEPAPPVNPY